MAEAVIKIAYSGSQARARGEFALSECQPGIDVPTAFWARIKSKLDSEVAAGRIAEYFLNEAEFAECWKAATEALARGEAAETVVSIVLGQGWPKITGIEVTKTEVAGALFDIAVKIPAGTARKLQFEWFEGTVLQQARTIGAPGPVHCAQLRGIWHRICQGLPTEKDAILSRPKPNPERAFTLVANSARGEVAAILSDAKLLRSTKAQEQIVKVCSESIEKLKQSTGKDYILFKQEVTALLAAGMYGPERFGLNLPLVFLIGAIDAPAEAAVAEKPKSTTVLARNLIKENYPGKGKLPIDVSADRMEATIGRWNLQLYDDTTFQISVDWIEKELKNSGIVYGYSEHVKKLREAISKRKDLTDRCLAAGLIGSAGSDPYLHPIFRETVKNTANESAADIRNSQQREVVKEGNVVAEIRYEKSGVKGKDIFGKEVSAPVPVDLPVDAGDGIRREGIQFFATREGSPQIDGMKIAISDRLILNEDVNLRTGNVYFRGNVEINGSIDDGSTVEVAGDLLVHGTIRGAFVRVGGRLIVEQGINTAGRGMVRCRSDVDAQFVENSKVACGGNLTVKRVILNSYVVAGGGIIVNPEGGVIGGGMVSARLMIRTGKLGLPKGAKTEVNVGVDWRAEFSMQIRQQRLEKINRSLEQVRMELREVIRKKKMQKSPKLEELSEQMTSFLQRGRTLVEKIETSLATARSRIVYDPEARIFVHDLLSSNCNITCGGQRVPVAKEIVEVEISAKRKGGQFIQAMTADDRKAS